MPPTIPDHELLHCIGRGSYGEVWLARNALGTWRAVKVVYRVSFQDDRPFEREFEGIRKFEPISRTHPSQLNLLHVGRGKGCFYYVMELADDANASGSAPKEDAIIGGKGPHRTPPTSSCVLRPETYAPRTLKSELRRRGHLPAHECVDLTLALTTALAHLHQHGLVHRDIKPSNIIFVGGVPKLADIGLVTGVGEGQSLVGTVGFIPPEGAGTRMADLFSLGKVLYEMCTGRDRQEFPQLPPDLRQWPDAVALVDLNEVVLRACDPDYRRRYPSAEDMRADLQLLRGGRSVRRLRLMERRVALLSRVGGVLAGLLVLGAGLYAGLARQSRNTARRLYVAEMNLAMQAWESGSLARAGELLEHQRNNPTVSPGFEWRLIRQFCEDSVPRQVLRGGQGEVWSVAVSLSPAARFGNAELGWITAKVVEGLAVTNQPAENTMFGTNIDNGDGLCKGMKLIPGYLHQYETPFQGDFKGLEAWVQSGCSCA